MYINPFWCGVAAAILAEVALVLIAAVVFAVKDGSKEAKQDLGKEGNGNAHGDN